MTPRPGWMDTPRGKRLIELLAQIQRRVWDEERKGAA